MVLQPDHTGTQCSSYLLNGEEYCAVLLGKVDDLNGLQSN